MRVAQLLCSGAFAGAEAVACALASALKSHMDRSLLYLILETRAGRESCNELVSRARSYDVPLRIFETDRRFSWPLMKDLQAAMREDRIDVAHSHSYKSSFWAPLIKRMDPQAVRGVFFTLHGVDLPPSLGLLFIGSINAVGAYQSDVLIACSHPIARYYRRLPLLRGRTHAILNGLHPGFTPPMERVAEKRAESRRVLAERHGLDPEAIWVASVGRLVAVKNHALLFEAVAQLGGRVAVPPVNVVVAGVGPLRDELEQLTERVNLKRKVAFLGQVKRPEELYSAIDVLALTSNSEGTPMVILESMAYGVPVLATRVGGIPDQVVEGETAVLFAAGNPAQCVQGLERLVCDAEYRDRLGRAGYRRASAEFSPERWAAQHIELYRRFARGEEGPDQ